MSSAQKVTCCWILKATPPVGNFFGFGFWNVLLSIADGLITFKLSCEKMDYEFNIIITGFLMLTSYASNE